MLLLLGAIGCAELRERREEAADTATQLGERGRFCLALARAVTAIESGSPGTAQDAIEEAVTQAPDDLVDDVRALADAIRDVEDRGAAGLREPEVQDAAEALHDRTRELCDPL
jgi:hypothetical protein